MYSLSLTIFILILFVNLKDSTTAQSIKLVNLVYRHGDRSPTDVYPTDPNTESVWPQGLGWLSKIGMNQQYSLGQWLRQRYMINSDGFMNMTYKNEEIQVLSSDVNRTLMSAYCNLAGLYPPDKSTNWNPDILWQPLPVHTRPNHEDNMLNLGAPCSKYDKLWKETLNSDVIKEEERENKEFYKFVANESGYAHESISSVWKIADALFCEKQHNFSWPDWVNETISKKIANLSHWEFDLMYEGKEKSRLMGGPLLKQMISNMQSFANGTNTRTKMFMYSGHDTTVSALMNALQVFNLRQPPYATALLVELYEDVPSGYFVRLVLRNETDTTYTLTIPGCSENCSLSNFIQLTKDRVPIDWKAECSLENSSSSTCSIGITVAIILVVLLLVLLLALLLVQFIKITRKNRYNRFSSKDIVNA